MEPDDDRRRAGATTYRLARALALLAALGTGIALGAEEHDGIEVGFTPEGLPYKGAADAPLTLHEYSDYLCPFCGRYVAQTLPGLIDAYVRTGRVRTVFHHFPIPSLHPTARAAHVASGCVGEQGELAFWRFHDALFERQGDWNRLPDPEAFLTALVGELGLDAEAYGACRESGRQEALVDGAMSEAADRGFDGTPTFEITHAERPDERHRIVGAHPLEYFAAHIDALLEGREPPKEPEPPKPELPDWAKPAALAIDADRPGFTVSGDPSRGAADAPLVIVEFTDYQCPACARHLADTQPAIDRELIDAGKVRWVQKSLPLREHPNAAAAATAAECAADQDLFDAMHRALFERQAAWVDAESPDAALRTIAARLDTLDQGRFAECLGSRRALERVLIDVQDAAELTRSTPTFVLLEGDDGRTLHGMLPPERFLAAVNGYLESLR